MITLTLKTARLSVKLTFEYKVSFLRGASSTGKSAICSMISDYATYGSSSGVSLNLAGCNAAAVASGKYWLQMIHEATNTLFFIDEEESFITTHEFAEAVKTTNNMFVLITRKLEYRHLSNLCCNTDASYHLKESKRYICNIKEFPNGRYGHFIASDAHFIVEDSKELYDAIFRTDSVSANSNTKLCDQLNADYKNTICIADGINFLCHIDMLVYSAHLKQISMCVLLPPSAEWLLLHSQVLSSRTIRSVDNLHIFNLEDYYYRELRQLCAEKHIAYEKGDSLHAAFLSPRSIECYRELLLGNQSLGETAYFA